MPAGFRPSRLGPVLACLLLLSPAWSISPAGAGAGPIDCPAQKPVGQLARGMVGTGWTVSSGETPEPFAAEILGVLRDGIAPGRDMIVVETSSPSIDAAGGVWQGMSGSPVYVDNELIGAVSHALSSGPSHIAGLTAAKDLFDLLGYPEQDPEPTASSRTSSIRTSSGAEVGNAEGYRRLRVPLHASGLTSRRERRLDSTIEREHAPFTAYRGSSSSGPLGAVAADLGAGDNFAAALSYGDVTFATIGTTALVCDGRAVAFGHQLKWAGSTEMGANAASALAIVDNEEDGPYKLAKVKGLAGTVDQDRLAGVRALLDEIPVAIPVVSEVTAENTGRTQVGKSYAVVDKIVPSLAFYHFIGHVDSTFDQITGGSSEVFFRIKGETAGGAFEVERDNLYSTHEDISIASAHELERYLWTLLTQPFEEVDFTKVKVKSTFREQRSDLRVRNVRISKNGSKFDDKRELKVEGGDVLDLRVRLRDVERTIIKVEMQVTVPKGVEGNGSIEVSGSGDGIDGGGLSCFFDGDVCKVRLPRSIDSFDEVIEFLESRDKNNVLVARLNVGRRSKEVDRVETSGPVSGYHYVSLDFPGGRGEGEVPHFSAGGAR